MRRARFDERVESVEHRVRDAVIAFVTFADELDEFENARVIDATASFCF